VTNYKHRIFLNPVEMGIGAEIIDRSKTIREKISSRMLSSFAGIVITMPTYKSNTCEGIKRLINDNKKKIKFGQR
jgi:hypothetical protein